MAEPERLFLVARVGWKVDPDGGWTRVNPDLLDRADEDRRFVPVAAFADRATAEVRMHALELEAARVFNPFWRVCPFRYLARAPEEDFRRALVALAGPVPEESLAAGRRLAWCRWWDENALTWPDHTLVAVWELFELQFHAILEVEVGDE